MYKHFRLLLTLVLSLSLFTVFLLLPKKAYAGCNHITVDSVHCDSNMGDLGCHNRWCDSSGWCTYVSNEYLYNGCWNGDFTIKQNVWTCSPGSSSPCGGGGGSCFTGDTEISTPDGEKEIKDIKEGDVVKSFDPETGEITESTVTNPYSKVSDHIYTITTSDGRVVKTTAEHPFYVGSESDQLPISTSLKVKSFLTRMKIYWVSGIHVLKTSL